MLQALPWTRFTHACRGLLAATVVLGSGVGGCAGGDDPGDTPPGAASGAASGTGGSETSDRADADPFPVLDAGVLCPDSGYLCAFLLQAPGSAEPSSRASRSAAPRVSRWPDSTPLLRIVLPTPSGPSGPSPEEARRLQQAALRGLLAWDRQPFAIQVMDRDDGSSWDPDRGPGPGMIRVTWHGELEPGQAGRVVTRWEVQGDEVRFEVMRFELALAVRPPGGGPLQPLSVDDMERVAAHEMGHALGLGHSENPGDLMYPTNTGRALSPRDYRTVQALYRLEPGSRVEARQGGP